MQRQSLPCPGMYGKWELQAESGWCFCLSEAAVTNIWRENGGRLYGDIYCACLVHVLLCLTIFLPLLSAGRGGYFEFILYLGPLPATNPRIHSLHTNAFIISNQ